MARHPMCRRVSYVPNVTYFKPAGIPLTEIEEINLSVEEVEAIRLKDLEGMEQEPAAAQMKISRTTFARILQTARQKLAEALLNGKAIRIEGGCYEMAARRFQCLNGHDWEVPFETMVKSPPHDCPKCGTTSIMPIGPLGAGWGGRGRGGRHHWQG